MVHIVFRMWEREPREFGDGIPPVGSGRESGGLCLQELELFVNECLNFNVVEGKHE